MAPAVFDNDGTLWAEVGTRGKGDVSTGTNHPGFRTVVAPARNVG